MQYLYLIQCQQFLKIGVANDVEVRLAQLATGNPYPLHVVAAYGFENASAVETVLHQKFSHLRKFGEWFEFDAEGVKECIRLIQDLGGRLPKSYSAPTEEEIEEAEEVTQYLPTIE